MDNPFAVLLNTRRFLFAGFLIALLPAIPARATAYTYSTSVDLSSPSVQSEGQVELLTFSLPSGQPSFPLAVGDTLSGTITFDQTMSFTNSNTFASSENLMLVLTGSTGVSIGSSQNVQLNGVTGSLATSNPQSSTDTGNNSLFITYTGIPAFTSSGAPGSSQVAFTGLSYSLTVTSEGTTGISYIPSQLTVMAPVGDFSATPEPKPLGLFAAGLAAVLLLQRSRWGRPSQP
jgi:hypothetical protein